MGSILFLFLFQTFGSDFFFISIEIVWGFLYQTILIDFSDFTHLTSRQSAYR